jgi:23S rRNA U2552 (ribose-2'-O)-methylase RlmE/FtsJ
LKTNNKSDSWYKALENDSRFRIIYGPDGTGSVYNYKNLEAVIEESQTKAIDLVVSDGGFEIKKNEQGKHMENYQELFSSRIIMSEILVMMKTLKTGGHFVCKLFDTFSSITASMIYVVAIIFEETFIVKPLRSRIVNSERYNMI